MGGPCGCSHKIAIGNGIGDFQVGELPASKLDFRLACGISRALFALQHLGSGQQLGAMADGSDRFLGIKEVPHHGEHFLIEPQILRCPATGHDQGVVIGRIDAGEICV